MFRTILFSAIVLCASVASADWYTFRPDYSGGYRTQHSNGYSSSIRPDYSGGWRITGNDGSRASIRPDYSGGYRVDTYRPTYQPYRYSR